MASGRPPISRFGGRIHMLLVLDLTIRLPKTYSCLRYEQEGRRGRMTGSDDLRSALAHPNTKQFLKFAAVGLASLAVEYAFLVYLLQSLDMNYLMATTISFIASIVFNYILSMRYVFVHKEDMSRRREFIIFSVLSAIGLGLNDLYMFIGVGLLNIGTMSMKLISTFFVTWYNYFSRRKFLDAGHA